MQARLDRKVILIVKDTVLIAQFLQELLNDEPGYEALAVGHGAGALALLGELRVDLILLDVQLPGLSGVQVYDHLQAAPPPAALPVLFMTPNLLARDFAARRFPHVLPKPFDVDDLFDQVRT